ncbi:TPR end-of-group domain-containing protein [Flavobacterium gilvum]|uniref:Uncharacterized protein n=1 Tax=Flavobacterium gilvum TaxID=1492737 RepID=A0AAC9N6N1_9FLAO|nr:DKNYY domain-containing protein [Flavobacterium gilvum]AOW09854.1 hypothetical protein EM308_10240 [Flavobacterium gilvum]KFC58049.1 hypothetical protein FEM08_31170 [Flavobacterium gilvum]
MSQPVGITAKIQLPQDNYKKYIRKIAGTIVAQNIFDVLTARDNRDFFVFKYIKKEAALYAFFYFNYGEGQYILEHPLLAMLRQSEPYLEENANGYLIATRDSLNFSSDDFVYSANVQNGKFTDHTFTEKELKDFGKDADKHFFKVADTSYALTFPKVVDTAIVKKVKALQETHRVQMLKGNLHTATLEKPIEIFAGYFYNGQHFYSAAKDEVCIYDNINLQELRQTPYGVCDDKKVIVGNACITTDPAKFKMHRKGEQTYFSAAEAVYNDTLQAYPNSDGLSFRMLSEYVSEDKNHIYYTGIQLAKQETGAYELNTSGYFHQNILLFSKTQVRAHDAILENIDAPTFEILSKDAQQFRKTHELPNPSGAFAGCFVLHCRDKSGEFIIHNYDINTTKLTVERISSLEEYLAKARTLLIEMEATKGKNNYPDYNEKDEAGYFANMNKWLANDFEEKYTKWRYNDSFLRALNNYFFSCFQLYKSTNDKQYLEATAQLYSKVKADCFLNPYIFHNTACIFAALGNTEEALSSISGALHFGYDQIELIWKDKDLQMLFNHPQFVALKNYYQQIKQFYPLVTLQLLEKVEMVTDGYYKKSAEVKILSCFILPPPEAFNNEVLFTEEQKLYAKVFLPKLTDFVNNGLQHGSFYYKKSYERLRDYPLVNASTHFVALNYFFAQAHTKYTRGKVAACMPIIQKIKTCIAAHVQEAETQQMVRQIKASAINRIFGIV